MIIASAIKFREVGYKHPTIMMGLHHHNILQIMCQKGIKYDKATAVQGFMTDDERFLNRFDAKKHAIECGQIKESESEKRYSDELFSEDLWP